MSVKRVLLVVLVASAVMLAVGVGPRFADTAHALPPVQEPDPPGVTIPYPGRLSGDAGQPVADATYDFTFALYDAETGGEPFWSEMQEGVAAQDGAFNVLLGSANGIPVETLDGGERWLAVGVRGPGEAEFTALNPRQRLSAASSASPASPTAPSNGMTCPHDHVGEVWSANIAWSNGALKVLNYGNGPSIWGWNGGGGSGLRGYATGTGLGVYGESQDSAGVVGRSTSGHGVEAYSGGGTKSNASLRADNTNTTNGMAGYLTNNSAYHTAHFQNTGIGGVLYLENGGDTGGVGGFDFITAVSNGGGDTQFRVASDGSAYSDGGWKGAADFAELISTDGDPAAYEPGDVLVISVESDRAVVLSSEPYSPMVIGVYSEKPGFVGSPHVMEEQRKDEIPVAVVGIVSCKVSAENGPIHRGDLLATSSIPGHAMRADDPPPGTILGKALEPLATGTGVIQILVTLQ